MYAREYNAHELQVERVSPGGNGGSEWKWPATGGGHSWAPTEVCGFLCSVRPPVLLALRLGTSLQPSPPLSESRLWSQLIGRPTAALLNLLSTLVRSSFVSNPAWRPADAPWSPFCSWLGPSVSWIGLPAEFWGGWASSVCPRTQPGPQHGVETNKGLLKRREVEGSLGYRNALSGWNFPTPKMGKGPNCAPGF